MWPLYVYPPTPGIFLSHYSTLSSSDVVPPALRLIEQTQERHACTVRNLESELAYSAEALALKSNLLYSDLPKLPYHVMPDFNPPLIHRPGFHCLTYDLGIGPPLPKSLAIQLLHTAVEFAVLLRPYAMGVYRDAGIIWRAVLAAESPGHRRRTPSAEEVAAVVEKWADERAREGELEEWVAATERVIERLQEVVAGKDTPVVEVALGRWRWGAYASGVAGTERLVRRRVDGL